MCEEHSHVCTVHIGVASHSYSLPSTNYSGREIRRIGGGEREREKVWKGGWKRGESFFFSLSSLLHGTQELGDRERRRRHNLINSEEKCRGGREGGGEVFLFLFFMSESRPPPKSNVENDMTYSIITQNRKKPTQNKHHLCCSSMKKHP